MAEEDRSAAMVEPTASAATAAAARQARGDKRLDMRRILA